MHLGKGQGAQGLITPQVQLQHHRAQNLVFLLFPKSSCSPGKAAGNSFTGPRSPPGTCLLPAAMSHRAQQKPGTEGPRKGCGVPSHQGQIQGAKQLAQRLREGRGVTGPSQAAERQGHHRKGRQGPRLFPTSSSACSAGRAHDQGLPAQPPDASVLPHFTAGRWHSASCHTWLQDDTVPLRTGTEFLRAVLLVSLLHGMNTDVAHVHHWPQDTVGKKPLQSVPAAVGEGEPRPVTPTSTGLVDKLSNKGLTALQHTAFRSPPCARAAC